MGKAGDMEGRQGFVEGMRQESCMKEGMFLLGLEGCVGGLPDKRKNKTKSIPPHGVATGPTSIYMHTRALLSLPVHPNAVAGPALVVLVTILRCASAITIRKLFKKIKGFLLLKDLEIYNTPGSKVERASVHVGK